MRCVSLQTAVTLVGSMSMSLERFPPRAPASSELKRLKRKGQCFCRRLICVWSVGACAPRWNFNSALANDFIEGWVYTGDSLRRATRSAPWRSLTHWIRSYQAVVGWYHANRCPKICSTVLGAARSQYVWLLDGLTDSSSWIHGPKEVQTVWHVQTLEVPKHCVPHFPKFAWHCFSLMPFNQEVHEASTWN